MSDQSGFSRRTFLKGSAATAAALALPAALLRGQDTHGHSTSKRSSALRGGSLTIAFPGTAQTVQGHPGVAGGVHQEHRDQDQPRVVLQQQRWLGRAHSSSFPPGSPAASRSTARTSPPKACSCSKSKTFWTPLDSYIAADKATMTAFYKDVNPHMLNGFPDPRRHPWAHLLRADRLQRHVDLVQPQALQGVQRPEPAPGWTWDEFASAATKIADPPNRYGFAIGSPVPAPFTDVYPWVLTNGGHILNPAQSTSAWPGAPACIEAATFVRSLVSKKLINEPGDRTTLSCRATPAAWPCSGGHVAQPRLWVSPRPSVNKTFAIVPWPKSDHHGTPVGVGGFPMFNSCQEQGGHVGVHQVHASLTSSSGARSCPSVGTCRSGTPWAPTRPS